MFSVSTSRLKFENSSTGSEEILNGLAEDILTESAKDIMYQSVPSLTIPPGQTPEEFFERANLPPPEHKKCETPTPGTETSC